MVDAFERGLLINPMRLREEIKNVELSIARLEFLLKQYKTCFNLNERKTLSQKIKEESAYLKNSWQELESKLKEIGDTDTPCYFIKEQMERKMNKLLKEASEIIVDV